MTEVLFARSTDINNLQGQINTINGLITTIDGIIGTAQFATGAIPFGTAGALGQNASQLNWNATTNSLSVGTNEVGVGVLHVDGGTLVATPTQSGRVIYYEAIQPTSWTVVQDAILYEITGNGNTSTIANNAMIVHYLPGYTGSAHNSALYGVNDNLGTGQLIFPTAPAQTQCNIGLWGVTDGVTTGANMGTGGHASGSSYGNVGTTGIADASSAGFNIGVAGWAAGGAQNVGGWFTLNQTTPPAVSAALIADNAGVSSPIALFQKNAVTVVTIDASGDVQLAPGTLANGTSALTVTATHPPSPVTTSNAVALAITGNGSASQVQNGLMISFAAGYTGSSRNSAANFSNANLGTGTTVIPAANSNALSANIGVIASATGAGTGSNIGINGAASGAPVNFGLLGLAQANVNSGLNIGVVGSAVNAGTSPIAVGGWFHLRQTTLPTASAAIIVDNGAVSAPIALFQANGVTKVQIDASGNLTSGGKAVALTNVAPTSWTPTDQSGAALTFTSVSAMYQQVGNIVYAYGTLTYPSTADGTSAKISLPVAVPNQAYAVVSSGEIGAPSASGLGAVLNTVQNTSTAAVFSNAGAAVINSTLSLKKINFMLIYPAS